MNKIKISVGSLGGTVSMTKEKLDQGVKPSLKAHDLVSAIAQDLDDLYVYAENIMQVPSSYFTFDDVLHCYEWAKQQVENGAQGVVLTQGTDTLEETSFLLDLIWEFDVPLVLTGAMRSPQQAGSDGSSNLLAAILVAASTNSRGRGALVVMNDWIHEARWVQKNHSFNVDAFQSQVGVAGFVLESNCQYFKAIPKRYLFPKPIDTLAPVFLLNVSLSDSVEMLDIIAKNYAGIVVAGFGVGHVSVDMANKLEQLSKNLPVVVSSATLRGTTAASTYGYVGGEIDLQNKGVIMSKWLCPKKSRLLLAIILANKLDLSVFNQYLATLTY